MDQVTLTKNQLQFQHWSKLFAQYQESGMQAAVVVHLPMATVEVAQGTDRQTVEAVLLALKSVC